MIYRQILFFFLFGSHILFVCLFNRSFIHSFFRLPFFLVMSGFFLFHMRPYVLSITREKKVNVMCTFSPAERMKRKKNKCAKDLDFRTESKYHKKVLAFS